MSECIIARRGGGAAIPPSVTYPIVAILTESTTWTVPRTGTYCVSCIGCGGTCKPVLTNHPDLTYVYAGGGGGGIAETHLNLSKGNKVEVTVDSGITSFGTFASATAGGYVSNVASLHDGSNVGKQLGGSGGSASGGSIGNYSGYAGYLNVDYPGVWGFVKIGGGTNEKSRYGTGEILNTSFPSSPDYPSIIGNQQPLFKSGMIPFGFGGAPKAKGSGTDARDISYQFCGAVIIEQVK